MKPETAKIWLQRMLFAIAAMLLMAIVPIFFPDRLMDWIHQKLGLGELADQPVTFYMARSTSLLYAVHGLVILWAAIKLERLAPLVPLLAWLHVIIGVTLIGVDVQAGMPWWWTAAEGPAIAAGGLVMVWLWKQASPAIGNSD